MPFLRLHTLRTTARSAPRRYPRQPAAAATSARASFHTSLLSRSGKDATEKESGDEAARERKEEVEDSRKNKTWKNDLASESESAVKADRNETERDAKDDTEKLQKETADAPRNKYDQ